MEKLILSTKGELKYKLIFIITGLIAIAASFFAFTLAANAPSDAKMPGIFASALAFCYGLFAIIYAFMHCSGYIDMYSYHCEGKGIQGKGIKTFYLSNRQIRSVTSESYFLCLHTEIGEFKIICSKKYHMQAMAFFTNNPIR